MNIFKSNIEILKKSSPAKMGKRFVCCVIDMILVALVAELIFLGAFQIAKNSSAYTDAGRVVAEEVDYYRELTKATHIVEYVDEKRVDTEVLVVKNLYRAICLSYDTFGNNQQLDFKFDSDHQVRINGTHSTESDNVAYFYIHYLKNDQSTNIAVNEDIFSVYRRAFGDEAEVMFSFNKENGEIPVLKTQVAYSLFHFLFVNESDSIGQDGAAYYDNYFNGYSYMLDEAENLIIKSEPYNSAHYSKYKEAFSTQARCINIALVLSIVISCFIVLLVPNYLFKDGKTVAYKIFGLGVIHSDGRACEWYVPLLKTVIRCVGFIPVSFILYLFPPFNGGYETMFVPTTPDSGLSLALVIIIVLVAGGIINAFGLFTHKRQNLVNIIFDELVVDVHYVDEGERDETNHGRAY